MTKTICMKHASPDRHYIQSQSTYEHSRNVIVSASRKPVLCRQSGTQEIVHLCVMDLDMLYQGVRSACL